LTGLLETLDKRDLSRFEKFVASPYFTEKIELLPLLQLTPPLGKQSTKEDVWARLFPGRPFDDLHLRRNYSELIQLFYRFSAFEHWQEDELQVHNALLGAFSGASYEKWHPALAAKQIRRFEQNKTLEGRDYFTRFLFFRQQLKQKENTDNHKAGRSDLEQADQNLESFFALEKLRLVTDSLGYAYMMPEHAQVQFPSSLRSWLEESGLVENRLVKAYLLAVGLHQPEQGETAYVKLKELIIEELDSFAPDDKKALFIHLYNYCIVEKINQGDHSYYQEMFEWFQLGLTHKILMEEERLDAKTYRNIITVALRVEAFSWVERFIRDYTRFLPEEEQKNALDYNLAKVFFHQRRFDRVIEQLSLVAYSDLQYALGSRLLLLKTYYEMDEMRSLDSLLEAFRIFLRRKSKLAKPVKDQYLHLLKMVRRLAFVQSFDKEKIRQIRQQIEASSSIEKNWLLEKADEMLG
jgi:hypothetical protein